MKFYITPVTCIMLSACTSLYSSDPDSLGFNIPPGSILTLNRAISLPRGYTHAIIQHGIETSDNNKQDYEINCRLDFRQFGPRTIKPEKFIVTRTEDGQNWVSQPAILRFYTEIYLKSENNTDIIKMVCQQYGDQTDRNFTVAEMQRTFGDYFTLSYQSRSPTE